MRQASIRERGLVADRQADNRLRAGVSERTTHHSKRSKQLSLRVGSKPRDDGVVWSFAGPYAVWVPLFQDEVGASVL